MTRIGLDLQITRCTERGFTGTQLPSFRSGTTRQPHIGSAELGSALVTGVTMLGFHTKPDSQSAISENLPRRAKHKTGTLHGEVECGLWSLCAERPLRRVDGGGVGGFTLQVTVCI